MKFILYLLVVLFFNLCCSGKNSPKNSIKTISIIFKSTSYELNSKFYLVVIGLDGRWTKIDSFIHKKNIDKLIIKRKNPSICIITKQNNHQNDIIASPMFIASNEDIEIMLNKISGLGKVSGSETLFFKNNFLSFVPNNNFHFSEIEQQLILVDAIPFDSPFYNEWISYVKYFLKKTKENGKYYFTVNQVFKYRTILSDSMINLCLNYIDKKFKDTNEYLSLLSYLYLFGSFF